MNPRPQQNMADSLPSHPVQAVQRMTRISQALLTLAERETQALVQYDTLTFAILQDEKELLTQQYAKASEQFRNRLDDFRNLDRALLVRLEDVQHRLTEKSHANNVLVAQMRQRAEKNTQKTLLTVQELAQRHPLARTAAQQQERL